MYDVIIVGGGAAGMMCAITAARMGADVVIAEKNDRLGKKLAITGKGRCNVCNNSDNKTIMDNIPRNARFLYSVLSQFSAQDVMNFFEGIGVPLKTERGNRVFPVSDKAHDVVNAMKSEIQRLGIKIIRADCSALLIENGVCVGIKASGKDIKANSVVLATGGRSYPLTGSDGYGYKLAEQAGHTIIPPEPSLSAMETVQQWVKKADGLNLRNVAVKLLDNGKCIYEDFGELTFMGYGVSGPTVLSASAHIPQMQSARYSLKIDLKPALSEKQLDARILRDFAERKGMSFCDSLRGLLPSRLVQPVVELSGISPDKKVDEISKAERHALGSLLKGLSLDIKRFRPIEEAIITRGGVSIKEIDPKTMASKLCPQLYFAGEIIDCDAYTGGFNLQIAFSTGYAAGISVL